MEEVQSELIITPHRASREGDHSSSTTASGCLLIENATSIVFLIKQKEIVGTELF